MADPTSGTTAASTAATTQLTETGDEMETDGGTGGDTERGGDTEGELLGSTSGEPRESDGETSNSGDDATEGLDPCTAANAGAGHYCGDGIGGDAGALYQCNANGETVVKHVGPGCPSCVQCPAGFADYCEGGFTPPFSCADGL